MLVEAQAKALARGLDNTHFMQMDLDHLTFPDAHFDVATCSFGLFFLENMEQGLKNIYSKIKPAGKVALSTFSEGAFDPMSSLFLEQYEVFGYEAPPLSWKKITTDEQLIALFASAGIDDVVIYREPLGFHMQSANDWWDIVWNAGYRGLLSQMSEEELSHFKKQHLQEVQQLCDNNDTWLDTGVAIAVGTLA